MEREGGVGREEIDVEWTGTDMAHDNSVEGQETLSVISGLTGSCSQPIVTSTIGFGTKTWQLALTFIRCEQARQIYTTEPHVL